MKDYSYVKFFSALSGERRMEIVEFLHRNGGQNVSTIAEKTGIEQSAVSHSLSKLLACEFVHVQGQGKERIYSLNRDTVEPLLELIDEHIANFCQKSCGCCTQNIKGKGLS